ncbi:hypothetical protein WG68_04050 [Arsukibacterium ikkense]|uniref:Outer membrane protein beta-barrel domain-containing protein n=1 Tax=Arsukibacterium ikkense TaxID=336831 RepID=A0A0M2V6M8_9GAMM|nr:outer membrane beta-barrel protein [Arsukibacterium ikkense]KKO46497.1 hypothetical protein WG68_04050 [Arsukibacterium ikkense]
MKLFLSGLLSTTLLFTGFSANAARPDISWNYLSAGYAKANIKIADDFTIKPDGYQLNASYLLSETLYVRASYFNVSESYRFSDIAGLDLDASEFTLSLGLRQAASANIDAFFEAGYGRSIAGISEFGKENDNGVQAGAGFRYRATPQLELAAALRYSNLGDSSTFGDISARVRLSSMFDLYAHYLFDSDVSVLAAGVVVNF